MAHVKFRNMWEYMYAIHLHSYAEPVGESLIGWDTFGVECVESIQNGISEIFEVHWRALWMSRWLLSLHDSATSSARLPYTDISIIAIRTHNTHRLCAVAQAQVMCWQRKYLVYHHRALLLLFVVFFFSPTIWPATIMRRWRHLHLHIRYSMPRAVRILILNNTVNFRNQNCGRMACTDVIGNDDNLFCCSPLGILTMTCNAMATRISVGSNSCSYTQVTTICSTKSVGDGGVAVHISTIFNSISFSGALHVHPPTSSRSFSLVFFQLIFQKDRNAEKERRNRASSP